MTLRHQGLTIYLADDHEIVGKAIGDLLLKIENVAKVTSFTSGKDLYAACLSLRPDIVILDMEMPGWNGIQTLEKLRAEFSMPVIVLSMNDEKAIIETCLKNGARGYLHKNCTPAELKNALETVMEGNIFLSEETKKIMLGLRQSDSPAVQLAEPLTEKEYEVLVLVCEGLTSKEIGERLFISHRTVETRKNNLMQKFNVQTTGKLVAAAIKGKIVK